MNYCMYYHLGASIITLSAENVDRAQRHLLEEVCSEGLIFFKQFSNWYYLRGKTLSDNHKWKHAGGKERLHKWNKSTNDTYG